MSAAFCHLLELPPKMRYEPSLYVRLHRTLHPNFGRISGPVEAASVVTASALAWNLRKRRRPAKLAAAAAGCLAAAHAIFWTTVQPANQTMFTWKLDAIPQEWIGWRNQWEYSHAARAVLVTAALAMLAAEAVNESRR